MQTTIIAVLLAATAPLLTLGCASYPGVAQSRTGDDAVALNAMRGAPTAQISYSQAEGMKRQQDIVRGEIELNNTKRASTTNGINDDLATARNVVGTVLGVAHAFGAH